MEKSLIHIGDTPIKYHQVMNIVAVVFGSFGILTGIVALKISRSAERTAKESAQAAKRSADADQMANANALTPDVVITLDRAVKERWKFDPEEMSGRPMGSLPTFVGQSDNYDLPKYVDLVVACGTRIVIKNYGLLRCVTVTIGKAISLATEDAVPEEYVDESGHLEFRKPMSSSTFEIDPGSAVNLIVYAGISVKDWLDAGRISAAKEFEIPIDVNCGPDAARLHWILRMRAKIFEDVVGDELAVGIGPSNPPIVALAQLNRTII